jgi:uncharacterized spore protein YtfJ
MSPTNRDWSDEDVQELLRKVAQHLSVSRAFGTAYEKDGSLVIPAALVAGGFGGLVMPVGVYVVKDEQVRWVPAVNANLVIVVGFMTVRMIARSL